MKKTQKIYKFILVLKNVDEDTPNLEDSLFEAGCDDALINFRNGTVYLDFDRKASSLEDAVITAIKDVESASVKPKVVSVGPEHLVTVSDIAKRLKRQRQIVSLWIKGERRNSFPKPVMKLSDKSPLWKWWEILEWLYQHHLIKEKEKIEDAKFLENVNAALDERDKKVREIRQKLIKKFENALSYSR